MFVLTFANRVDNPEIPRDDEPEKILFFQKKLEEWENKLITTLEEDLNIPNEISFKVATSCSCWNLYIATATFQDIHTGSVGYGEKPYIGCQKNL